MKAMVCRRLGLPEVLQLEELPSPQPKAGQVLVAMRAASVNFPDALILQGRYQVKPELPFTPGYELAGVVESVGEGVTTVRPGDHVIAVIKWGAFAEQVIVPAERAWPIPKEIAFTDAAAFPLAYSTSYHALKDRAKLRAGETLLVLGAAGGVGLAAVQLGRILGARVIACASSAEKLATCRAHGADETVDYSREDFREAVKRLTAGKGVDVIADPVGGRFADPAVRSMAWGGRYLVLGFTDGSIPSIALNLPLLKGCSLVGVSADTFTRKEPEAGRRNYAELIEMIASGRLKPVVSRIEPLANAAAVLTDVMNRKAQGKIVLVP